MASTDVTVCTKTPEALLERCREDESGVQMLQAPLATPKQKRAELHTDHISPDFDALGFDPFDDQVTLVREEDRALELIHRRDSWLDRLPEAARAVLLEASVVVPPDAPRIEGAIAEPVQGLQDEGVTDEEEIIDLDSLEAVELD